MNLTYINDFNIPEIQIYRHLRDNIVTKDNSFIADSPKVVLMLLNTETQIRSILATRKFYDENEALIKRKNIPTLFVADKVMMREIVGHNIHHGVMMHGIRPAQTPLEQMGNQIIMLENITKNENIGAIARSAAALDIDSFIVSEKSPHPFGRKALRVSMGYASQLKIESYHDIFETLDLLKALGYKIFAAEVTEDATMLQQVQVPKKWVLLMGDEHIGLSKEILEACDETVMIEMSSGVKSFNVAVASSIMMYHFSKALSSH
jgi:tRNA G18 (ribose-2'-O)-methylase SpoU